MLTIALAGWLAGCTGVIANPGHDVGGTSGPTGGGTTAGGYALPPGRTVADPRIDSLHGAIGIRRLTRFEYTNTVRDLLGVPDAGVDLNDAPRIAFFSNNANMQKVGLPELEAYDRVADKVSQLALANLSLPARCSLAALTATCVGQFLPPFLQDAFRRPAAADEVTRYQDLYTSLVATDPPAEALRGVLQAVLLSPSFLYRTEIGDAGGKLDPYELASRLSYFVWGSKPDAALLVAAKNNALDDTAARGKEVARLLDDGRAKDGMLHIMNEWMGLDEVDIAKKGSDITTGLPTDIQTQLEAETKSFLTDALFAPGATFETLYDAKYSFISKEGATIYGVQGITSDVPQRVDLDVATRRGLFTQPLVLAAHTKESGYSVVQMGRFIREHALCQSIPPPPPNVKTEIADTPENANQTYRQKLDAHASNGVCASCHTFMDPPGFAYLPYDPVGRYKPLDSRGAPFDTTGTLNDIDGKAFDFKDAVGMLDIVAQSQASKACVVRKLTEYAFGRTLADDDTGLYKELVVGFEDNKGDVRHFLTDLATSPAFSVRGPKEQ